MSALTPRRTNILTILSKSKTPVSVDQLAGSLGVSRRTIFRDLDGIDLVLRECGLTLNTVPGKGICLSGDPAGFDELSNLLSSGKIVPQSKDERHTLLTLLLIDSDEMQKLYYYANALSVSEATISLDMDFLQQRLGSYGLNLDRIKGQGALLSGRESDMRRCMASLLAEQKAPIEFIRKYGYPSFYAESGISKLMQEHWGPKLDWMTDESLRLLELQLIIMVDRVHKRHVLTNVPSHVPGLSQKLADQICDAIESSFSLRLPVPERTAIGLLIQSCRAKSRNPLDINDDAALSYVKRLTFQMIDAFDPKLSPTLKMNEDLVNGLSVHLWSAIIRLKNGVHLHSEMQEQIKTNFPNIFEKSRATAAVLNQELHVPIPESEIAFIASHFGAAMMQLEDRSYRKTILKVGIVCVAGIGISYMMSSQVSRHFKGELDVVISEWNSPQEWDELDLLISSIPLDYDRCPVIVVDHVLTAEDYLTIRQTIQDLKAHHTADIQLPSGNLPDRLDHMSDRLRDVSAMLRSFSNVSIHADCTFDDLVKMIGYQFGTQPESGEMIYRDLKAREAISTQVIPQLSIALLHVRTAGVARPVVSLITPKTGRFTDPYFQNITGGLVLLAPQDFDRKELSLFGYISSALIEDEAFLSAVQNGDQQTAFHRIEAAMVKFLIDDLCGRLSYAHT